MSKKGKNGGAIGGKRIEKNRIRKERKRDRKIRKGWRKN